MDQDPQPLPSLSSPAPPPPLSIHPANRLRDLERDVARTRGRNAHLLTQLADLLTSPETGLAPHPHRAVRLYQRAIALENNVDAIHGLAELLATGHAPAVERDVTRAASLWESAVAVGHRPSMRSLAALLECGSPPIAPDPARAARLYAAIADDHRFRAVRFNLAWLLSSGLSAVPQDPVRAAALYEQIVAEDGDVNAIFNLACVLSQGCDKLPRDNRRAAALYERAIAEAEHACSMHNLGVLLSTGEGIERDIPRAIELLERAVEYGRREASFDLALVFANDDDGPPTPENFQRAMDTYERVMRQLDHMGAMINLAEVLWEGKHGQEQNVERAMELWESAIAQGLNYDRNALEPLGIVIDAAYKPMDDPEAVQMREHATAQGWHLIAMCNLAEMLLSGEVPRETERAMRLYEMALQSPQLAEVVETQELDFEDTFKVLREMVLEEGGVERFLSYAMHIYELLATGPVCSHAMYTLAEIYMHGRGHVARDVDSAVEWYERAIEHDDHDAMLALSEHLLEGHGGVQKDFGYATELLGRIIVESELGSTVCCTAAVLLAQLFTDTG